MKRLNKIKIQYKTDVFQKVKEKKTWYFPVLTNSEVDVALSSAEDKLRGSNSAAARRGHQTTCETQTVTALAYTPSITRYWKCLVFLISHQGQQ